MMRGKRTWIPLLMAAMIAMLLPVMTWAQGATVIYCPEAGFTTKVNFDNGTKWEDGNGLYIYTRIYDSIPYVLVNVVESDVTDLNSYIHNTYTPMIKEQYGNNLKMYTEYEYLPIGGKNLPAAMYTYDVNDYRITMLRAFDNRDGQIVIYTAKYVYQDDKEPTMEALDMIAENLELTNQTSSQAPAAQTSTQAPAAQTNTGAADATAFKVTEIKDGSKVLGRCTAPVDYTVQGMPFCCTTAQSATNPWLLFISAYNDKGVLMSYASARDYISNVTNDTPENEYNTTYHTPMLQYRDAAGYCDYMVQQLNPNVSDFTLVAENTYPEMQSFLREREAEVQSMHDSLLKNTGLTVDDVNYTMAARLYSFDVDGQPWYQCIACLDTATQMTAQMQGLFGTVGGSTILWEVPYTYAMLCPASEWNDDLMNAFTMFMENTSVTDQFTIANKRLSQELWDIITGRTSLAYGSSYSEDIMEEETSKGSDYDDERVTDYIFDQNDYTLSDGSHVKVSTAYDYVYEGDNGTIYASNSALYEPGGATQLYPNS